MIVSTQECNPKLQIYLGAAMDATCITELGEDTSRLISLQID